MNSANLDQIGRGDKFVGDEVFLFFILFLGTGLLMRMRVLESSGRILHH